MPLHLLNHQTSGVSTGSQESSTGIQPVSCEQKGPPVLCWPGHRPVATVAPVALYQISQAWQGKVLQNPWSSFLQNVISRWPLQHHKVRCLFYWYLCIDTTRYRYVCKTLGEKMMSWIEVWGYVIPKIIANQASPWYVKNKSLSLEFRCTWAEVWTPQSSERCPEAMVPLATVSKCFPQFRQPNEKHMLDSGQPGKNIPKNLNFRQASKGHAKGSLKQSVIGTCKGHRLLWCCRIFTEKSTKAAFTSNHAKSKEPCSEW